MKHVRDFSIAAIPRIAYCQFADGSIHFRGVNLETAKQLKTQLMRVVNEVDLHIVACLEAEKNAETARFQVPPSRIATITAELDEAVAEATRFLPPGAVPMLGRVVEGRDADDGELSPPDRI